MPNFPNTIPPQFASDPALTDAYRRGWNHGHGIACHNVPSIGDHIDRSVDYVGCGRRVNAENIREYHELLCFAAADNSRQYSPFEFTAHEFNSAETDENGTWDASKEGLTESLWEAFEAGTTDSIRADLAEYTDEDYGAADSDDDEDENEE